MFEAGFVEEVERLLAAGLREGRTASLAIGYREVTAYLDGELSLDEARERTVVVTRRFARRQYSWYRKDPRIVWVRYDDPERVGQALAAVGRWPGGPRMADYPFLKGHGTENDFVLLPDHDGSIHGALSPERVRALCDRRAGIGADGVLRVIRTAAMGAEGAAQAVEWFMDYRNADGWPSEMCGNGIRVFLRHLVEERLVDPSGPIDIATRDGIKTLLFEGDLVTVDLGSPRVLGETKVSVGATTWPASHVDMGNPHAVAFVDDEGTLAGLDLTRPPEHDERRLPRRCQRRAGRPPR